MVSDEKRALVKNYGRFYVICGQSQFTYFDHDVSSQDRSNEVFMVSSSKQLNEPLPADEELEKAPLDQFEMHWVILIWPILQILIVLIHVVVVGWVIEVFFGYETVADLQLPLWLSGMGILVIASGNLCQTIFQRATTRLMVFDDRVVWRRGFFSRIVMTAAIREVVGVDYGQTYVGRALDYGNVVIETRGVDQIRVPRIERPSALSNLLTKLQHSEAARLR